MATRKPARNSRKKLVLIPILALGVLMVYIPVIKSTFFEPEKVVLDEIDLPVGDVDTTAQIERTTPRPPPAVVADTVPRGPEARNDVPIAFGTLASEEESAPVAKSRVLNGFLDFGGTQLAIVDGRVVARGDRVGDAVVEQILPGKVLLRCDGEAEVLQLASSRSASPGSDDDGGDEAR